MIQKLGQYLETLTSAIVPSFTLKGNKYTD